MWQRRVHVRTGSGEIPVLASASGRIAVAVNYRRDGAAPVSIRLVSGSDNLHLGLVGPSDYDRERRLGRLLEIGRSLVSEIELDVVLERVLEAARDLTGARYAAIGVLDEPHRSLERFLTAGIDEKTQTRIGDLPHGRGVLGVLITDPHPLRLEDVGSDPRSFGFPPGHPPMSSFLGVPIMIRGRAFGNLYSTEKRGGAFDAQDEETVVVLAEWAAVAIATAQDVAEQTRRRSIAAAESERARWARELHDDTLQELAALKLLLAAVRRSDDPDERQAVLAEATERIDFAVRSLRGLITDLRPAALDDLGLGAALEALVDRVARATGMKVELSADFALEGGRETSRLAREVEEGVYRLVQECLANVTKHAAASRVEVSVRESAESVDVVVRDDGRGFDVASPSEGFGLVGMRERVALAGGTMAIDTAPGAGTAVRLSLPVARLANAGHLLRCAVGSANHPGGACGKPASRSGLRTIASRGGRTTLRSSRLVAMTRRPRRRSERCARYSKSVALSPLPC